MKKLIEETTVEDAKTKEKQLADGPKAAYGYGGKFGVQQDRFSQHLFLTINIYSCNVHFKFLPTILGY
jgi:hypothetical protein